MPRNRLFLFIASSLLALPLPGADLYRADDSPGEFETIESLTLTDPVQQRDIVLRLHVPAGEGPRPLVVYSHGAFCSPAMYDAVVSSWAARGYVVLLPQHIDALGNPEMAEVSDLAMLLSARIRDLSFLLDASEQIEQAIGRQDLLDTERAAVAGHSFGGMIAQIKSGLRLKPGEYLFDGDPADSRYKAAVIMSGVGPMPQMTEDAFSGLTGPLIASGGTLDKGDVGSGVVYPWEWRLSPYTLAPDGNKFSLVLDEGDHYLGGLICRDDRGGPADPAGVSIVASVTQAFLDAYVLEDPAAARWLANSDIGALTDSRARFERK